MCFREWGEFGGRLLSREQKVIFENMESLAREYKLRLSAHSQAVVSLRVVYQPTSLLRHVKP